MEHVTDGIYTYGRTKESHDDLVNRLKSWKETRGARYEQAFLQDQKLKEITNQQIRSMFEDLLTVMQWPNDSIGQTWMEKAQVNFDKFEEAFRELAIREGLENREKRRLTFDIK